MVILINLINFRCVTTETLVFLSNGYTQHGARTQDSKVKSSMLFQLSQPDVPKNPNFKMQTFWKK